MEVCRLLSGREVADCSKSGRPWETPRHMGRLWNLLLPYLTTSTSFDSLRSRRDVCLQRTIRHWLLAGKAVVCRGLAFLSRS